MMYFNKYIIILNGGKFDDRDCTNGKYPQSDSILNLWGQIIFFKKDRNF